VCLTLQGEDIFIENLIEPYRTRTLELIRANLQHVDRFLAVSDYYAAHMSEWLHVPRERIDIVPLGINMSGYTPRGPRRAGEFRVGYLGRIAPEKGLHLLAEAFHRMVQNGAPTGARLELAGYLAPEHKAYLDSIEQQLSQWGLGERFTYHGEIDREHKIEFLRSLDVFAAPSVYQDPKGLSIVEAMAAGVPIVAARSGSYPEMIEKHRAGLLVNREDVADLAAALSLLATDADRAAEFGRRGPVTVEEHYSAPVMARAAIAAYNRALGQPDPAFASR
jgi:glycosyltransferase involved in cell wall biosynthesis